MTITEILDEIESIFNDYIEARDEKERSGIIAGLPNEKKSGKLYEAYILGIIAKKLVEEEHLDLELVNGNYIYLKSSPGPINRDYPYIKIKRDGNLLAELWTDIEFTTLSYSRSGKTNPPSAGEYHEIDIAVVDSDSIGRPIPSKIWLAIECKNTDFKKSILRQILGLRRELSLMSGEIETQFRVWPTSNIRCHPPVCLQIYSSDPDIVQYSEPGKIFEIDFIHVPF